MSTAGHSHVDTAAKLDLSNRVQIAILISQPR